MEGHLRNPNAKELLHHLFPPLAFLIDECFEAFSEDVVKEVSSPLLTRKAIKMLKQNLSEREQVIWKALGDYWIQPRSNWQGHAVPYKPFFHGGWSPGVVVVPDDEEKIPLASNIHVSFKLRTKACLMHSKPYVQAKKSSGEEDLTSEASEVVAKVTGGYDEFRDELMRKRARIALCTYSRTRTNNRELTVHRGEYLQVSSTFIIHTQSIVVLLGSQVLDDDRKWWKCKNTSGEVGYVPHTLLKALIYTDSFDVMMGEDDIYRQPR